MPDAHHEMKERNDVLSPQGEGARILLVEDDPTVREVMGELLKALGYDLRVACDGPEALEVLGTAKFDLVLTDHSMPGMTGLELAKEIRRVVPDLPLVLLTGAGPSGLAADSGSPFALVLSKPAPVNLLREAVIKALATRPRQAG